MKLDKQLLDRLSKEARVNPRLRVSYDLRNSDKDKSQRILNALHPKTVLPIHRHQSTNETLVVLRGAILQKLYDDNGKLLESFVLKAGGDFLAIQIPAGQFHSLECIEEGTVIFEAKDGVYKPIQQEDIIQ